MKHENVDETNENLEELSVKVLKDFADDFNVVVSLVRASRAAFSQKLTETQVIAELAHIKKVITQHTDVLHQSQKAYADKVKAKDETRTSSIDLDGARREILERVSRIRATK